MHDKLTLHVPVDTRQIEIEELKSVFKNDNFSIERKGVQFGLGETHMVLTFLLGAITSGITYDLMKEGIKKLFIKKKPITIQIKSDSSTYILKMNKRFKLVNNERVYFGELEEVFDNIEENNKA